MPGVFRSIVATAALKASTSFFFYQVSTVQHGPAVTTSKTAIACRLAFSGNCMLQQPGMNAFGVRGGGAKRFVLCGECPASPRQICCARGLLTLFMITRFVLAGKHFGVGICFDAEFFSRGEQIQRGNELVAGELGCLGRRSRRASLTSYLDPGAGTAIRSTARA